MSRLDELKKVLDGVDDGRKTVVLPLLEDIEFLENRLSELRKLTMIRIHPKNPERQETTQAGKQYKEYLQQYNNCIKTFLSVLNKDDADDDDEFGKWLEEQNR